MIVVLTNQAWVSLQVSLIWVLEEKSNRIQIRQLLRVVLVITNEEWIQLVTSSIFVFKSFAYSSSCLETIFFSNSVILVSAARIRLFTLYKRSDIPLKRCSQARVISAKGYYKTHLLYIID